MKHLSRKTRCVSVIDIGTNSSKLLVAGVDGRGRVVEEIKFERETNRIGEGLAGSGEIGANAVVRTISTLERFRRIIRQYDCDSVFAFSTEAMRSARNSQSVIETIENETGLSIHVLTGEEEARFAYLSARRRAGNPRPHTILFDLGGGSTEFVLARRGRVVEVGSLPLGALALTERFITTDPIEVEQINALRAHVATVVSGTFGSPAFDGLAAAETDLIASGGSVTTIWQMLDGGGSRTTVATSKIRIGDVRRLAERCAALPLEKRRRLPGLEPDRADIIPAGLAVVIAFMDAAGKRVLQVNPGGVRNGVLIHLSKNNLQW